MNWDDLRFVLALGRSGTFKDAAESLGVHYTSVARKIKQFEESLGTRLFDSHPRQQVLTPHGEKLMQVAERIENEIFVLDRELLGKESQLSGLLRISTVEPIAMAHCKDFADFIDLHPDVELEIIADTTIRDLSKRESDIALRATKNPPEHLLGRQVATMRFAPFAMPELIERQGAGTPIEDWPWVHWTMEGSRPMWKSWLEKVNSGNGRVIIVSNGAVFNQMVESDALAIIQAASLPDVIFIGGKTVEQQQLQTIKRLRELAVKHQGACQKKLVSLLLELNIRISNRKGGIISAIDGVLEDATNGLSAECRIAIDTAKVYLKVSIEAVQHYDDCLEKSVTTHADCKKLLKLEGDGTMNAINLYLALGCSDIGLFSKGKDASACIGLTPIQHSSGGFVKLGSIGKHCKNSMLRSQLICGAMAAVNQAVIREAKTRKDVWLKGLVERRGKKCAAVALANKTVRTAFAMLTQGTEYKAELLAA